MPYRFEPSVVTARRRHRGQVVYLGEDDCWTPVLQEAELIEDEAHGDIRLLDAEIAASDLTEIRLARVAETAGVAQRVLDGDLAPA
ncbi:MAG: DUF2849 domain-containing protein [Pseudomonadota bacterium]